MVRTALRSRPDEDAGAAGVPSSPAGPAHVGEPLRLPPAVALPRSLQILRFSKRQIEFVFRARRELGEVFQMRAGIAGGTVVSCHPDHARSLFTAEPELVPSLTAESPVRPIVGPELCVDRERRASPAPAQAAAARIPR